MKCHKHPNIDAVGTCVDCGVGLCQECIHTFTSPMCSKCNLMRLTNEKSAINGAFIKNTIIGVLVALYFFGTMEPLLGDSNRHFQATLFLCIDLYFGFFVMYGWTFLSPANTVKVTINDGIIALLIRKAFKFVFSCLIGGFVGPYQIWKMTQRLKTINETIKFIQTNA